MSAEPIKPATPPGKRTLGQQVRRWGWTGYICVKMLPGEVAWSWRTWRACVQSMAKARADRPAVETPVADPARRSTGAWWRRLSWLVRFGWPRIIKAEVATWVLQARTGFAWGQRFMETRAKLRGSWRDGLDRQTERMGTDGTGGGNN